MLFALVQHVTSNAAGMQIARPLGCCLVLVLLANGRICRVKEGSYEASLKAGEEVVKLGAEHRIISLEWDKIPPPGKIHTLTRARRTNELLNLCTELDIKVLMFGHHQNDQTGNFARGNVHNVLMLASFPDHIHGLRMRLKSFMTGVGDPVYHVNRCGSVYCSV